MDSGSSGSMQSSSGGSGGGTGGVGGGSGGGEEEYNSRGGESISSFLNQQQSNHIFSISNQQQPPPPSLQLSHHQQSNNNLHLHHHHQQQQQPIFFDLHSQNLEAFPQSLSTTQNANLQYNNEMVWSRPLRSEPNYGNFGNFTNSSSSSSSLSLSSSSLPSSTQQSLFAINQAPPLQQSSLEPTRASSSSQLDQHHNHHQPNLAVKNPKKRTRASRRAPTTVLTTDTANFRQMVQEFTGIPAAPFSAATSPYSRRFDLFSTVGGGAGSALGSLYHPLRPSAQKVPFIGSSSSPTTNNTTSMAGTSDNLGLQKQPQNLFNMHNQLLNFQPLLQQQQQQQQQQQTNLPPSMANDQAFFVTRSQGATTTTTTAIDELGMGGHQHHQQQINANNLGGFSNPGRSEARNDDNIQRFGGRHEAFDHGNEDGNGSQHVSSFIKLNSSSSSEFYPEKVLENGSSGGTDFRNYNN